MHIVSFIKSLKPHRREHWIMLSLLLYSFCGVLKYYMPLTTVNTLYLIGGILFVVSLVRYLCGNSLHGFSRVVYFVLILWSCLLTIHMFLLSDSQIHGMTTWLISIFITPQFFPNLLPFILLVFPRNYKFDFLYLWKIMWLLCICYLLFYPFSFWNITHYSLDMSNYHGEGGYGDFITNGTLGIASLAPSVLMLFLKKYITDFKWKCFLVSYLGSILLLAFMARRGGLSMSLIYLISAWLIYAIADTKTSKIKLIFILVAALAVCFNLFSNLSDSFFSLLLERGSTDSRSGVEDAFYLDMHSISDWLFGRGWYGRYFDYMFGDYRLGLETGYLTLILRGGLLYLIAYALLLIVSFFNGVFRSKNIFCKSFGVLCLMQVIELYPFGWPKFNFFHFVIWLGVWICNNRRYRRMNDEEVRTSFFVSLK